jgi:hypothetical protein
MSLRILIVIAPVFAFCFVLPLIIPVTIVIPRHVQSRENHAAH